MIDLYETESVLQIALVTGVLGGGAAFLAGRAIAQTWRPFWSILVYMGMLGAGVRFVHFALFEATLLSPGSYVADTLYLIILGALAWRMTRAGQMATQYYWLYERTSPLTWRPREPRDEIPAGNRPISG
jgi:NO-binding membrane sensor protein with MHYT domain